MRQSGEGPDRLRLRLDVCGECGIVAAQVREQRPRTGASPRLTSASSGSCVHHCGRCARRQTTESGGAPDRPEWRAARVVTPRGRDALGRPRRSRAWGCTHGRRRIVPGAIAEYPVRRRHRSCRDRNHGLGVDRRAHPSRRRPARRGTPQRVHRAGSAARAGTAGAAVHVEHLGGRHDGAGQAGRRHLIEHPHHAHNRAGVTAVDKEPPRARPSAPGCGSRGSHRHG